MASGTSVSPGSSCQKDVAHRSVLASGGVVCIEENTAFGPLSLEKMSQKEERAKESRSISPSGADMEVLLPLLHVLLVELCAAASL